jgi:uncharacterized protein YodC (DUF2158 family)
VTWCTLDRGSGSCSEKFDISILQRIVVACDWRDGDGVENETQAFAENQALKIG